MIISFISFSIVIKVTILCVCYNFFHSYRFINKYDFSFDSSFKLLSAKKELSKLTNNYIKIKRLKQLQSEGKNYTSYIEEQKRIQANDEDSDKDKLLEEYLDNSGKKAQTDDINKKITEYMLTKELKERNKYIYNIAFLPDISLNNTKKWFYNSFIKNNNESNKIYIGIGMNVTLLNMPNIHDYNTKRYEILWMNYLRELNLSNYDSIIAHGSSAEAILRYAETDTIKSNVILIDPTDIYTAGERHGRSFHYYNIINQTNNITIISTYSNKECENLFNNFIEYRNNIKYFDLSPSKVLDNVETLLWTDKLRKVIDNIVKCSVP